MSRLHVAPFAGLLVLLLAGCATTSTPPRPLVPQGDDCLALFEQVDQRIEAAGVADAGYARIEGYPYLRSDRFSASFASEISDMDTFWEWVGYLRANEDEARDIELRNLGLDRQTASSTLIDLRGCGAWLRSWELDDKAFREHLLSVVTPPHEYSTVARTLGLYPLAKPFLNRGVREYQEEVLAEYAKPLDSLEAKGELVLWKARVSDEYAYETVDLSRKPRDRLGRIGMLGSEVIQMAQYHAPQLWIDTADDYDLPGQPTVGGGTPGVNVRKPVVYYLPGYTRFGGRNLLQISYFVWFDRHQSGDSAEGPLDGVIWRVTFDERGQPLMHDTIHACGCYHFAYPVRDMRRREVPDDRETMLFPQAQVPEGQITVRLKSGTHAVQRVLAADQARAAGGREYELQPYDELLLLPLPEGGTRSLFGPDGLVAGTERGERFWLWPSGVRSAGAMRQWGRHATTFVGQTHFDDPFLFETVLVAPPFEGPALAADPHAAEIPLMR
ncbi:hypothetical protein [Panacagrimonas sp.]|uniref:hypothetical protein n=1 Tax=Panacagrimonas sp. TaxID=2480088 RepID=UPI003B52E05E